MITGWVPTRTTSVISSAQTVIMVRHFTTDQPFPIDIVPARLLDGLQP
jgi:hypothetical protein